MPESAATRRWRKTCADYAESGLTSREFAAKHQLNPKTLLWWRSRLKKLDQTATTPVLAPAFTELRVVESANTVVLALDHLDAHIVVDAETDLALLRRLLQALC